MIKLVQNMDLIKIPLDVIGDFYLPENTNFRDKNILFIGFCFAPAGSGNTDLTTGALIAEKLDCSSNFITLKSENDFVVRNFPVAELDTNAYAQIVEIDRVLDFNESFVTVNAAQAGKVALMYVFYGEKKVDAVSWGVNVPVTVPGNYRGALQQLVGDVRNWETLKFISFESRNISDNFFITLRSKNGIDSLEYMNSELFRRLQSEVSEQPLIRNSWVFALENINWDNSEILTSGNEITMNFYF